MRLWRLIRKQHQNTAHDGTEGLHASGCWHPKGIKMVYLASTPALCQLEMLVNSSFSEILEKHVLLAVQVKEILIPDIKHTISNNKWSNQEKITQALGAKWFKKNTSATMQAPSVLGP